MQKPHEEKASKLTLRDPVLSWQREKRIPKRQQAIAIIEWSRKKSAEVIVSWETSRKKRRPHEQMKDRMLELGKRH